MWRKMSAMAPGSRKVEVPPDGSSAAIKRVQDFDPFYMGVEPKIGAPPNHPTLIGFSIVNHPFWGTTIFGNTHIQYGIYMFMFFMFWYLHSFSYILVHLQSHTHIHTIIYLYIQTFSFLHRNMHLLSFYLFYIYIYIYISF